MKRATWQSHKQHNRKRGQKKGSSTFSFKLQKKGSSTFSFKLKKWIIYLDYKLVQSYLRNGILS